MIDLMDVKQIKTRAIEEALPAHLIQYLVHELKKRGWEFREDLAHYCNTAALRALRDVPEAFVQSIAREIEALGEDILTVVSNDDPRHTLCAVAYLTCRLVDEGRYPDPEAVPVKAALLILEDAAQENTALYMDERQVNRDVNSMLFRLSLLRYYTN